MIIEVPGQGRRAFFGKNGWIMDNIGYNFPNSAYPISKFDTMCLPWNFSRTPGTFTHPLGFKYPRLRDPALGLTYSKH